MMKKGSKGLLVCVGNGVNFMDLESGKSVKTLNTCSLMKKAHGGHFVQSVVALSREHKVFATGGGGEGTGNTEIRVWQINGDEKAKTPVTRVADLKGHKFTVWGLDYDPKTRLLASGDFDGEVKLWKFPAEFMLDSQRFWNCGNEESSISLKKNITKKLSVGHSYRCVYDVALFPKTTCIASASMVGVHLWDMSKKKEIMGFYDHTKLVFKVSPLGPNLLMSCSPDETVNLYDIRNPEKSRCVYTIKMRDLIPNPRPPPSLRGRRPPPFAPPRVSKQLQLHSVLYYEKSQLLVLGGYEGDIFGLDLRKVYDSKSQSISVKPTSGKNMLLWSKKIGKFRPVACLAKDPDNERFLYAGHEEMEVLDLEKEGEPVSVYKSKIEYDGPNVYDLTLL